VKKPLKGLKVVVSGVGAAGVACTRIMLQAGIRHIIGFDTAGALWRGRSERMNPAKEEYARLTNPANYRGDLKGALKGADLFFGVSGPGTVNPKWLAGMAKKAMVFAMANPTPEVMPEEVPANVAIVATGRSDYPNQINNVLCFPGIFKGAFAANATCINEAMKLAAAKAIAGRVSARELGPGHIIPSVFDREVGVAVAKAVAQAAVKTGVARRLPRNFHRIAE